MPLTICCLTERGREAFRTYRDHLKRVVDSMPWTDEPRTLSNSEALS